MRPVFALTALALSLSVLSLSTARAAVLRVALQPGQTYSAQVRYSQAVQITSLTVQARPGAVMTAQELAKWKTKYQATVQDAFEGLNGGYRMTLSGRSTTANPPTLPLKATIDAPSFTMNLDLALTPNAKGYLYQDVSPVNSLSWKGGGQPPLDQLRQDTRSYLIAVMTNANGPFGFEGSGTSTLADGLRPEALGLANVAEGDLEATTTLSWPEPLHFRAATVAKPGQGMVLLGQLKMAVLGAAVQNEGYIRSNFPERVNTGTLTQMRLTFPSGSDPVTVDVTLNLTSTLGQTWSVQPK